MLRSADRDGLACVVGEAGGVRSGALVVAQPDPDGTRGERGLAERGPTDVVSLEDRRLEPVGGTIDDPVADTASASERFGMKHFTR